MVMKKQPDGLKRVKSGEGEQHDYQIWAEKPLVEARVLIGSTERIKTGSVSKWVGHAIKGGTTEENKEHGTVMTELWERYALDGAKPPAPPQPEAAGVAPVEPAAPVVPAEPAAAGEPAVVAEGTDLSGAAVLEGAGPEVEAFVAELPDGSLEVGVVVEANGAGTIVGSESPIGDQLEKDWAAGYPEGQGQAGPTSDAAPSTDGPSGAPQGEAPDPTSAPAGESTSSSVESASSAATVPSEDVPTAAQAAGDSAPTTAPAPGPTAPSGSASEPQAAQSAGPAVAAPSPTPPLSDPFAPDKDNPFADPLAGHFADGGFIRQPE